METLYGEQVELGGATEKQMLLSGSRVYRLVSALRTTSFGRVLTDGWTPAPSHNKVDWENDKTRTVLLRFTVCWH